MNLDSAIQLHAQCQTKLRPSTSRHEKIDLTTFASAVNARQFDSGGWMATLLYREWSF